MEDEEFILENSPLDAYLKEVTSEDFSRYESLSNIENFTDDIAESSTATILENQKHHHKSGIQVSVENKDILLAASQLLDSNLMSNEDYNLLIDIHEEVENALKVLPSDQQRQQQQRQQRQQKLNIERKTSLLNLFYDHQAAIFVLLVSLFINHTLLFCPTALFVVLLSIFGCLYYIYCFQKNKESEPLQNITSSLSKTKDFVKIYINIDSIVDKCIKHIKEIEVINTGLQIYRAKMVVSNQLLLSGRTQKCLKLRNVLLEILTDLVLELRTNLRHLLQSHSDLLFSFKEEYVSSIALNKFGDIISFKKPSPQDDNLILPEVSLEKLKSLVYLYRALLSEFVLGLTVCLYSSVNNGSVAQINIISFSTALEQLSNVSKEYPAILDQTLGRSLKVHFSKEDDIMTTSRSKINNKTTSTTTKDSDSEQYFNNCKINLYSALKRMEEAEDIIHRNTKDSSTSTAAASIDLFEKIVLEFFMNIENARACVEDLLDLHKPKSQKNIDNDQANNPVENDGVDVLGSIPMSAILEREMGDRMYEGESLKIPVGGVEEQVDIEYLQQQLKEKRESKRLLKELKTVFKVKESPEGLLSFPLAKIVAEDAGGGGNEDNEESEDELTRQEEQDEITLRQARRKNKYLLQRDEDFCGTAGNDNEDELQFEAATPIGLPVGLLRHGFSSMLKNNMMTGGGGGGATEETFGSSDSDGDSDIAGDIVDSETSDVGNIIIDTNEKRSNSNGVIDENETANAENDNE